MSAVRSLQPVEAFAKVAAAKVAADAEVVGGDIEALASTSQQAFLIQLQTLTQVFLQARTAYLVLVAEVTTYLQSL